MRKPDDELKIDISEIFGGDLPSPSESLEDVAVSAAPGVSESTVPVVAETENKFQEWMTTRNAELEIKAQELEQRLQEIQAQQAPAALPVDSAPIPNPSTEVEEKLSFASVSDSPIDFDAPIAPPFMGAATTPNPPLTSTLSASAVEEGTALPDPQKAAELKKLQADYEFMMLYDEFRNIIAHELKDLVGEKKTYTMLGRTVELARGKYPEIFRNANWDAAGNLLEDGSVDSQRIIENKNALDFQKMDLVLDTALSALLNLRLQAVEKGLGTGLKNKVRAHMYQWIQEKIQKAGRDGKDTATLQRLNGYVAQV